MTQRPEAELSSRVWTLPNILSLIRLALVPVFLVLVILGHDVSALIVLVISSLTDYLDGILARRLNQVTRLGQLLDPAADRLFIFATLIGLAIRGIVPWWLLAVVVLRDVVLLLAGLVLRRLGYGPLPVHHLGKIATFCLLWAFPVLMLGQAFPSVAWFSDPIGWGFGLWGAFLYWWAGALYLRETVRLSRKSRVPEAPESDTLGR
ncbi:MAG TPA: CDP-alcohol phosphatidyltransferase family protein [Terrimesophilobacter sp.]|nr:CDP-alcohol phosphatidyltransferase family protein [Terrimesophilobacter sp.]HRQ00001.1 CDP-alcohol phosphatidyltransferase family protein [Terrimesophilobacter sp.]